MGIGVADILNQVSNAGQVIDLGAAKIELNLSDAAALSMDTSGVLKQAASDASLVSATKSAADLATQTARQKIGLAFGTDENAQNQVYTTLAGIVSGSFAAQQAAKADIDAKNSISFLDDPIGWLGAKLTINQDIEKHNAANQNKQAALQQISDLNNATSSSATLQSQFSNSVTTASAESAARMAATEATVKANQFSIQSIVYNNDAIKEALSATKEKLANMFSENRALNEDASLGISQAHLALAQQEFEFRKEEKLKTDGTDNYFVNTINQGRAMRGLPPLDALKANVAVAALKGKGPGSEEFAADYQAGESAQAGSGAGQLAPSPAAMMARLSSGQVINVSPAQEIVKQRLADAAAAVTGSKTFDPKAVAQNNATFNTTTTKMLTHDASEVKPGDATNIFSIAPIAQIVKASPAAAAEPVYTKVLQPLMASGVDLNNPNNVIAATVQAVQDGKISYNDAVGLSTIYQAGAAANLAQRDLPKFGIQVNPSMLSYNSRLGTGFGSKVVDLTKPDLLGRYINTQLAAAAITKDFQTSQTQYGY